MDGMSIEQSLWTLWINHWVLNEFMTNQYTCIFDENLYVECEDASRTQIVPKKILCGWIGARIAYEIPRTHMMNFAVIERISQYDVQKPIYSLVCVRLPNSRVRRNRHTTKQQRKDSKKNIAISATSLSCSAFLSLLGSFIERPRGRMSGILIEPTSITGHRQHEAKLTRIKLHFSLLFSFERFLHSSSSSIPLLFMWWNLFCVSGFRLHRKCHSSPVFFIDNLIMRSNRAGAMSLSDSILFLFAVVVVDNVDSGLSIKCTLHIDVVIVIERIQSSLHQSKTNEGHFMSLVVLPAIRSIPLIFPTRFICMVWRAHSVFKICQSAISSCLAIHARAIQSISECRQ